MAPQLELSAHGPQMVVEGVFTFLILGLVLSGQVGHIHA
jgi:hypothetical protein